MCKFEQIIFNPPYIFKNLHYIPKIQDCFLKYRKYLLDDFAPEDVYALIESVSPFFWVILDRNDEFMGFVFLDNFTGSNGINYSAEITTCFDKKAWGNYTRYSAKFFLKKCFDEFGLQKLKAQIYPDNFRVTQLLKSSGFQYECTIPNETIRHGQMQDIAVYGLYKNYYYKKEVTNEQYITKHRNNTAILPRTGIS